MARIENILLELPDVLLKEIRSKTYIFGTLSDLELFRGAIFARNASPFQNRRISKIQNKGVLYGDDCSIFTPNLVESDLGS